MAVFGERNPESLRQENIRLPLRIRKAVRSLARDRHVGLAEAYRLLLDPPCAVINRGGDPLTDDDDPNPDPERAA